MKCELSVLTGLKRKLDIQLSVEQVQSAFNNNYKKHQKKAKLSGFRDGKVPLNHIKSMYSEEIKKDTTITLINKFYLEGLQQNNLKPASHPEITPKNKIAEDKEFVFSATFEIQPTVTINKTFKVKLTKPSVKIEETDIQAALKNIRSSSATFTVIKESRGVTWGDIVELEIKELSESIGIEKKPLLEITKDHKLEITGLVEEIVNMKVKDTKTLTVTLSKDYPIPEHKNKTSKLEVTLLAIKSRSLPELNEEFISKFKCKNLDELKTVIRQNLEKEKQDNAYNIMREETLKQITNKNPINELPDSVVENQKQHIIASVRERLQKANMSKPDIEKYEKKYQNEFTKQAVFIVKSSYLIYALATELNISASPQEIKMYSQNNSKETTEEQKEEEYEKTKNFIIHEKTLNHLINEATKK